MYCRICGVDSGSFRASKGQILCGPCDSETPRKVSREAFERRYWNGKPEEVPAGTRNEFWSDYLSSTLTLKEYIEETTETLP